MHRPTQLKWLMPLERGVLAPLTVAIAFLTFSGCGEAPPPSGTVAGNVTQGGKPIEQWQVVFYGSDGVPAGSAKLGASGDYKLDAPIPAGEYKIAIAPPEEEEAAGEESDAKRKEILKQVPQKYWDANSSGLAATVNEGDNTIPLEI